jgi:hypothetical protein
MGEPCNPAGLHKDLCRRTTLAGSPVHNAGGNQREIAVALVDASSKRLLLLRLRAPQQTLGIELKLTVPLLSSNQMTI